MRDVRVVPYDANWPSAFAEAAAEFADALGAVVAIHHIGSTSVPGLAAKPVIDLLVELDRIERADERSAAVGALGFEARGEYGMPGRRFFRRDTDGERTHHVHAWESGHEDIERHLALCAYLRAHADEAAAYGELKMRAAAAHPHDIEGYMEAKDGFVQELQSRALVWRRRRGD